MVTAVREDLAATAHDFPIPQNDRVLGYVEAFQGRLRTFLAEGMARGAEFMPMIQSVFREEGLPLDLAYVPLVESAFKPTALSRASARGVWQFMRPTARENGLTHDWYIDERADPGEGDAGRGEVPEDAASHSSTAIGTWRWRRTTAARAACSARSSARASTTSGA